MTGGYIGCRSNSITTRTCSLHVHNTSRTRRVRLLRRYYRRVTAVRATNRRLIGLGILARLYKNALAANADLLGTNNELSSRFGGLHRYLVTTCSTKAHFYKIHKLMLYRGCPLLSKFAGLISDRFNIVYVYHVLKHTHNIMYKRVQLRRLSDGKLPLDYITGCSLQRACPQLAMATSLLLEKQSYINDYYNSNTSMAVCSYLHNIDRRISRVFSVFNVVTGHRLYPEFAQRQNSLKNSKRFAMRTNIFGNFGIKRRGNEVRRPGAIRQYRRYLWELRNSANSNKYITTQRAEPYIYAGRVLSLLAGDPAYKNLRQTDLSSHSELN